MFSTLGTISVTIHLTMLILHGGINEFNLVQLFPLIRTF